MIWFFLFRVRINPKQRGRCSWFAFRSPKIVSWLDRCRWIASWFNRCGSGCAKNAHDL